MIEPDDFTVSSLVLPDGRNLAHYEFGDPSGTPCVSTAGTPASGLAGLMYDAAARDAGVRLLSVDKPGYGRSTYNPRSSLASYTSDIAALLDHLDLHRVAVAGQSGGGPHTLALAHDLPTRVTAAFVVSGMGPASETWVRKGMRPLNRRLTWLARYAPWLLHRSFATMRRDLRSAEARATFTAMMMDGAPAVDAKVLRDNPDLADVVFASLVDALRDGHRAAAQEFGLFARPWHFALEDIRVPVTLWHGVEDANVPVSVAREAGRRLPHSESHILDGVGHVPPPEQSIEIMAAVRAAAEKEQR